MTKGMERGVLEAPPLCTLTKTQGVEGEARVMSLSLNPGVSCLG